MQLRFSSEGARPFFNGFSMVTGLGSVFIISKTSATPGCPISVYHLPDVVHPDQATPRKENHELGNSTSAVPSTWISVSSPDLQHQVLVSPLRANPEPRSAPLSM